MPAAALSLLMSSLPVLAQEVSKAPTPKNIMSQPWAVVVVSFFLVVLIGVGSFLSSKRSHQD
jgi:hypothetical protein